jgi:hypothetical protein
MKCSIYKVKFLKKRFAYKKSRSVKYNIPYKNHAIIAKVKHSKQKFLSCPNAPHNTTSYLIDFHRADPMEDYFYRSSGDEDYFELVETFFRSNGSSDSQIQV